MLSNYNSKWKSLRQKADYEERPEERKFEDNPFFERSEKVQIEITKAVAVADNDENNGNWFESEEDIGIENEGQCIFLYDKGETTRKRAATKPNKQETKRVKLTVPNQQDRNSRN